MSAIMLVCAFMVWWSTISYVNREYSSSWLQAIGIGFMFTLGISVVLVAVWVLLSILFI